jgi:hypothetical protein
MLAHPALTDASVMRGLPSSSGGFRVGALTPPVVLVDEALAAYIDWREDERGVADAYAHSSDAHGAEANLRLAAYVRRSIKGSPRPRPTPGRSGELERRVGRHGASGADHIGETTPTHPDPNERTESKSPAPARRASSPPGRRSTKLKMSIRYVYDTERLSRAVAVGQDPAGCGLAVPAAARWPGDLRPDALLDAVDGSSGGRARRRLRSPHHVRVARPGGRGRSALGVTGDRRRRRLGRADRGESPCLRRVSRRPSRLVRTASSRAGSGGSYGPRPRPPGPKQPKPWTGGRHEYRY